MTLKKYLVSLATDFHQLADFCSDPGAAAENAGLSKEDRAVLLSGDQNRLYASLTRADDKGERR